MKKILTTGGLPPYLRKIIFVMRISLFLIFLSSAMAFSAESYSQSAKFTLNLENVTVKEVIQVIEEQSEFIFFYQDRHIDLSRKVSLKVSDEDIEVILNKLFSGTLNVYTIRDRQVIIGKSQMPVVLGTNPVSIVIDEIPDMLEQPRTKEVTGIVNDSNGQPLIGVSIVVKNTTIGTITNISGYFLLEVPIDTQVLLFSYVGMKPQEIDITDRISINIVMEEELVGMEEVVVVGYGTQRKESVVGAISQVDNSALIKSGSPTVTNALVGKLSGVLTMQSTGQPGMNETEIIIRGLSSWNTSEPLVLVDGVERDFINLDPNEINTISVLKDASATAVFGARGANGVIIVTTKRGVIGKPKISFTGSYGTEKATRLPEYINSYTTMSLLNVALMNEKRFSELIPQSTLEEYRNPSTQLNSIRYPDVNWYELLTVPFAPTANANLNVVGGTDFVKYFCSIGYLYEGSFFKGYKEGYFDNRFSNDKFNYRANLDFTLTKTTQLSVNVGGDINLINSPSASSLNNNSLWLWLYTTGPSRYPAYFPSWVLDQVPDPYYPDAEGMRLAQNFGERGNPYNAIFDGAFQKHLGSKLFTDIFFDQKLDFLFDGLSLKGKVSLSTYYENRALYSSYHYPQYLLNYEDIGITGKNPWVRQGEGDEVYQEPPLNVGIGGMQDNFYSDLYSEIALNYNQNFGNHYMSGLVLANRQQKDIRTEFPYYNAAFVGRATYDYSHKYLFEANIGYTGSERFAPGNRYGFFPSVAIGWVISEEEFFKTSLPWINKFKLRYSDGLVGSDYATSRWLYITEYSKDVSGYIIEDRAANITAQWEEARKRDIGIETGFLNNLFTLSIDLFDEQRSKMLLTPRGVTMFVGNSFKDLNLGKLKKHGIDIEAGFNNTIGENLHIFLKGIFGFNENRIIYKDDPPYTPEYAKDAGKPLGSPNNGILLTGTGYYTSVDDIHNNPASASVSSLVVGDYVYLDFNNDGIISTLDRLMLKGNVYPPLAFSFSGGFTYKGFAINLLFYGTKGKYINFNGALENEFVSEGWCIRKSQLDYWTPDNPDATHSTLRYHQTGSINQLWMGGSGLAYESLIKDRHWRNSDFLRLKDIYMEYKFNSGSIKKSFGLSDFPDILVYMTGNNLLTFTRLLEGDPERKNYASIVSQMSDSAYPVMASVKLGLKVSF